MATSIAAVVQTQWKRASRPTVVWGLSARTMGHKWAKFGPQMGHKAKRQP